MTPVHTYVMARLNRWVIWCIWKSDLLTPDPTPRHVKSWWHMVITRRKLRQGLGERREVPARAACPVDEIEAGATDVCVQLLPAKLLAAVVVGYLTGGTAAEKADELGCDRATYFRRLERAYAALLGLFNDYEVGMVRVDVEVENTKLEAQRPVTRTESLTKCDSGPRIRATLV